MDTHLSRSRSRSPVHLERRENQRRRASTSPRRHRHQHQKHRRDHGPIPSALPFNAPALHRSDLKQYRPMFALYLDIQKNLFMDELPEDEVKGRWKSFVGKWNRGELAEGWYDPTTSEKANASNQATIRLQQPAHSAETHNDDISQDGEYTDEDFGPSLPAHLTDSTPIPAPTTSTLATTPGPTIPNLHDLRAQYEHDTSLAQAQHHSVATQHRHDLKSTRAQRATDHDDLAPRAAPGTRDRHLEKKRETNFSNRAFAHAAHDTGPVDLPDDQIVGAEDDLADLKRLKRETDRKKNERELRREQVLRAKRAEREERTRDMRLREEKTMEGLKELARLRFGAVG